PVLDTVTVPLVIEVVSASVSVPSTVSEFASAPLVIAVLLSSVSSAPAATSIVALLVTFSLSKVLPVPVTLTWLPLVSVPPFSVVAVPCRFSLPVLDTVTVPLVIEVVSASVSVPSTVSEFASAPLVIAVLLSSVSSAPAATSIVALLVTFSLSKVLPVPVTLTWLPLVSVPPFSVVAAPCRFSLPVLDTVTVPLVIEVVSASVSVPSTVSEFASA